jgi:hypothetical protein
VLLSLFLGFVFDCRGLEAFLPVLSIKFPNLDFWFGISFGLQINTHVGDPVSVGIRPRPVPWQDTACFAELTNRCLGSPQIQSGSLFQWFFHVQREIVLRNNEMKIASHEAIATIAFPSDQLVLVGHEFSFHATTMATADIFSFAIGHVFVCFFLERTKFQGDIETFALD